jgi:mannan endo-1,4-beta-mannosidase
VKAVERRLAAIGAVCALALGGCRQPGFGPAARAAAPTPHPVRATLQHRPGTYLGVYSRGMPGSYHPAQTFASAIGRAPNIAVYYSTWDERFQATFAQQAWRHGSIVLVQMQPFGVGLASIAAGASDVYLRAYADAVRDFGHPVILSFGHEVNGPWYPWGTDTPAPDYVAAWRHIVTVFREQGAGNVTWLWAVNVGLLPELADRYPGSSYVNWIGVTGYYASADNSFRSVLAPTIAYVRRLAPGKPVLIDETGIAAGPARPAQIANLFRAARRDRLLGVVYFDVRQSGGAYAQDWQLEGDPASLTAFRRAARRYIR